MELSLSEVKVSIIRPYMAENSDDTEIGRKWLPGESFAGGKF